MWKRQKELSKESNILLNSYRNPQAIGDFFVYRFCKCLNINKNLTEHIRKKLNEDGINSDYIYPTKSIDTWNIFESSLSKNNVE